MTRAAHFQPERLDQAIAAVARWAGDLDDWAGRDVRNYREGYRALRRLFTSLDLTDRLSVLACANAVYGWMPTILDTVDFDTLEKRRETLEALRDARSVAEACGILARLDPDERARFLRTINNSIVGTSKFLHFLNPVGLPIFDSRVAKALGHEQATTVNCDRKYMAYLHAVVRFLGKHRSWPGDGPYSRFLIEGDELPPSPGRALEYALFLHNGTG